MMVNKPTLSPEEIGKIFFSFGAMTGAFKRLNNAVLEVTLSCQYLKTILECAKDREVLWWKINLI